MRHQQAVFKISQPVCLGAVLFIILVISKNSVFLADCFSGLSVLRFGYSRLIFLNLWLQVYTDRLFPAHQVLPSEPWGPAVNSVFSTGQIPKFEILRGREGAGSTRVHCLPETEQTLGRVHLRG